MSGRGTRDGAQKPLRGMERRAGGNRDGVCVLLTVLCCLLCALPSHAQDDMVKFIESKRVELGVKEESLKKEEQRLAALKKDVDEKIDRYTKLLSQIETALKRIEQARQERVEVVVKAYEAMAPEEAASRLTALDSGTALLILQGMKSKKAGLIMAAMEPRKAADLTRRMTALHTVP